MMIEDHFDARSLLYFNCNWCHFLNLIFCNVRFSHPDAPRMCVCVWGGGGEGGRAEIFIYIYVGWDHLWGFKILNFNIFGGFQKYHYFWGYENFVDIS